MSLKSLSATGIIMPTDFPIEEYDAIQKRVAPLSNSIGELFKQFAGAWNAVSYRYAAFAEYQNAFNGLLVDSNKNLGFSQRYEQEKYLFGFFNNGFSCIESAFYGLFSIGSIISVSDFPMSTEEDQQKVTLKTTIDKFSKAFPGDDINSVIIGIRDDPSYVEWKSIRNVLSHRAAPGREISFSLEKQPDVWQVKNITLDENMTVTRRVELARLLFNLLQGINAFVSLRL